MPPRRRIRARPAMLFDSGPPEAMDTFYHERLWQGQGMARIAGVDEVGRGPLAGPVVAASVILPDGCDHTRYVDSKKLGPERCVDLHEELRALGAAIGVGIVSPEGIDRLNILQASLLAMRMAVENLPVAPDCLLVDGTFPVPLAMPQQPIVKGDARSASIAAASIVAKSTRDALMREFHQQYPQYHFDRNKGYPTADHRRAIALHGPCPLHRKTFAGVREFVGATGA